MDFSNILHKNASVVLKLLFMYRQKTGNRQEDGEKNGQDQTVIFIVILQQT
jgi:hypothetical protein